MGRNLSSLGALCALAFAAGIGFWATQPASEVRAADAAGRTAGGDLPQFAAEPATTSPVVVELFTSQGCSSCPPADALLGELAGQPGVLALSYHVDYWDYIGWKDPFASSLYTERQRDYAAQLGLRYIYTPQIVVNGRHDVVGSRRRAVTRIIEESAGAETAVAVTLDREGDGQVSLSAGVAPEGGATVWLVTFDDRHETKVARGENSGRTLVDSNVVRELLPLGTWTGEAKSSGSIFPRRAQRGAAAVRSSCSRAAAARCWAPRCSIWILPAKV